MFAERWRHNWPVLNGGRPDPAATLETIFVKMICFLNKNP